MLLITRVGGVGDRAGGFRRFATNVDAGGAGGGYILIQYRHELCQENKPLPEPLCDVDREASRLVALAQQALLCWCWTALPRPPYTGLAVQGTVAHTTSLSVRLLVIQATYVNLRVGSSSLPAPNRPDLLYTCMHTREAAEPCQVAEAACDGRH